MTAVVTLAPSVLTQQHSNPSPQAPAAAQKQEDPTQPPPLDPHNFVSRSLTPFNAEPRVSVLCEQGGFYTPQHLLFHRNRDPLPGRFFPALPRSCAALTAANVDRAWIVTANVDAQLAEQWGLSASRPARVFDLGQLKSDFGEPSIVAATLECAGNRRSEMSQVQKTEGIQWSSGVIANIAFAGLSLRTFLLALGIPDPYGHLTPTARDALSPSESTLTAHAPDWAREAHVHFISAQRSDLLPPVGESEGKAEERRIRERDQWFASSIPLAVAMLPSQQCLLSWGICSNAAELRPTRTAQDDGTVVTTVVPAQQRVNARIEPLEHAHGFPLRAVLPGHAGARWVKWIREIRVECSMNQSAPMKDDYKMLIPPSQTSTSNKTPSLPAAPTWLQAFKCPAHRADVMRTLPPMMRLTAGSAFSDPSADEPVRSSDGEGREIAVDARGKVRVRGYAVGQDGYAVQSVLLKLIPDDVPARSISQLRAVAAAPADVADGSSWQSATRLQRDGAQLAQLATLDRRSQPHDASVSSSTQHRDWTWSWSWTLWEAELEIPLPAARPGPSDRRWALVLKTVTTAGVEQVQTAPWNLRGFCQRSWPVLRGLRFVSTNTAGDDEI